MNGKWIGLPVKTLSDPFDKTPKKVTLDESVTYIDKYGVEWTALAGLETDGKSVPPIFWILVGTPFAPDTLPAAVIHDQFCDFGARSNRPSKRVHAVFKEMLEDLPVTWWKRNLMAWAVKHFGPRWKLVENK